MQTQPLAPWSTRVAARLPFLVFGLNAAFVAFAFVVNRGDPLNVGSEASELTWLSSVQLLIICAAAWLCAKVHRAADDRRRPRIIFSVMAFAFAAAAFDERFMLHERLREHFFKPRGIGVELPGIPAGDFALPVAALIGLLLAVPLFLELRRSGQHVWLLAAVGLSAFAVVIDIAPVPVSPALLQVIEEMFETCAQGCFVLAFARHALKLSQTLSLVRSTSPLSS